jgi:hypothetical protein
MRRGGGEATKFNRGGEIERGGEYVIGHSIDDGKNSSNPVTVMVSAIDDALIADARMVWKEIDPMRFQSEDPLETIGVLSLRIPTIETTTSFSTTFRSFGVIRLGPIASVLVLCWHRPRSFPDRKPQNRHPEKKP